MITIRGDAESRCCLGGGVFRRWAQVGDPRGKHRLKCKGPSPQQATATMLRWLSPTAKGPLDWPPPHHGLPPL